MKTENPNPGSDPPGYYNGLRSLKILPNSKLLDPAYTQNTGGNLVPYYLPTATLRKP